MVLFWTVKGLQKSKIRIGSVANFSLSQIYSSIGLKKKKRGWGIFPDPIHVVIRHGTNPTRPVYIGWVSLSWLAPIRGEYVLDSYSPLRHESHRANRGGSITPTKNVVCIQTSHNQPDRAKWILYTVNRIVAYTTLEFLGALCELFSLKNSLNHCRIKRFKPTKKKRVLLLKLNSISLEKFGERELLLHVRPVNSIMWLKFPDYFALTALAPFSRTLASSPMTPIFSPTLGPTHKINQRFCFLKPLKKKTERGKSLQSSPRLPNSLCQCFTIPSQK